MKRLSVAIIILVAMVLNAYAGDFPVFSIDINSPGHVCNEDGLNYLQSMAESGIDYVL